MVCCRNKEKGKKKKKRATGHGMHEIAWGVIMIFVSELRDYWVFVIFLLKKIDELSPQSLAPMH